MLTKRFLIAIIFSLTSGPAFGIIIWNNGSPVYNQGSSNWHGTDLYPQNSPMRAQDFIFNNDYTVEQVLFYTASYVSDTGILLEGLDYWIFEDNAGDIGSLVYSGSVSFSEIREGPIQTIGTTEFRTYEYLADLPDSALVAGHYWFAARVNPSHNSLRPGHTDAAEAFWAHSDGSGVPEDYLWGLDSTTGAYERGDDWYRIEFYGTGSFAFRLYGRLTNPAAYSFPWPSVINAITHGKK